MTRPLSTGKKSVNLAPTGANGPRVSKIRRDPPPPVKELVIRDPHQRDTRMVVIGVVTFALALAVIAIGFSGASGWSPKEYTVEVTAAE